MLVGWRKAKKWMCIRCGRCCKKFIVPLKLGEAYYLSSKYGSVVEQRGRKYYLRKIGGKCLFLAYIGNTAYCTIQFEKPRACRLYPFQIYLEPKFGLRGEDALYLFKDYKLFIYLDNYCLAVGKQGYPVEDLLPKVARYYLFEKPVGFLFSEDSAMKQETYGKVALKPQALKKVSRPLSKSL